MKIFQFQTTIGSPNSNAAYKAPIGASDDHIIDMLGRGCGVNIKSAWYYAADNISNLVCFNTILLFPKDDGQVVLRLSCNQGAYLNIVIYCSTE